MKVQVKTRKIYNVDRIYPSNKTASLFAVLVGKKTLSTHQLRIIKELGFEVEIVPQTLDELLGA